MCVAYTISANEALQLWIRTGHDPMLFANHELAARAAGLTLSYIRQGDLLTIEAEANDASARHAHF